MFTILCHPGPELLFQLKPGYSSLSKCKRIQLKLMKAISLQVSGCSAPLVSTGNHGADLVEGAEARPFSVREPGWVGRETRHLGGHAARFPASSGCH